MKKKGGSIADYSKAVEIYWDNFVKNFWKNNQGCIYTYVFYTLIFIAICAILTTVVRSPLGLYNVQKYFFVITIPLIILFVYVLNISTQSDLAQTFGSISIILGLIGVLVYLYIYLANTNGMVYYTNYIFLIIIALIGLSIVYNFLKQYLERLPGWPGFIARFIFYIPCMCWDAWAYLMNDIRMTPYSVYILVILEIIAILSYLYLPKVMDSALGTKDGMVLLKDTYYLEKGQLIIANSDRLKLNKVDQTLISGTVKNYATNYAFSMWLYLNPKSASSVNNNQEVELFSYGYADDKGIQHVKPMIRYYGGGDGKDQAAERNKLIFYFVKYPPSTEYQYDQNTFYDLTIPMQKWNHIVVNYNRNVVDIYLNGHLERSFIMTNTMPKYSDLDNIRVSADNGLRGGIRNVIYYQHSLSMEQIAYEYNKEFTPFV